MQLDFIIRSVNMKHKAGIHSLWRRTIDHENGDHRDEEIASFARLLQGYMKITTRDMVSRQALYCQQIYLTVYRINGSGKWSEKRGSSRFKSRSMRG